MFKIEENVPQVYRKSSYDFYIYTKLLDLVFCDSFLKSWAQQFVSQSTKGLDIFVNNNFEEKIQGFSSLFEDWKRGIRRSYYDISYWRGTEKGISLALSLYKQLSGCEEISFIVSESDSTSLTKTYSITVSVLGPLYTQLLDCLMSLVLPPSVGVEYIKVSNKLSDTAGYSSISITTTVTDDYINNDTMLSIGSYDAINETDFYEYTGQGQPTTPSKQEPVINPVIISHTAGQTMYVPTQEA